MRKLIPLVGLLLGVMSCSDQGSVRPVTEIVAPASAPSPAVYSDYAEVADLFAQRNDTTYLINFWATWCKPCIEELPLLEQVQQEYADDGLRVILVILDTKPEAIDRIPDFLARQQVSLPTIVLTDEGREWKRQLDQHWSGDLPTSFIYRKSLRYVYRRNFRTLLDVRQAVSPLIVR
jgi:thiol-disulfide isomerase/thioredoxin